MRSRSSPDQGVVWLGKADRKPAAPRSIAGEAMHGGEVAVREHELSARRPGRRSPAGRVPAPTSTSRRRDVRGPGCSRREPRRDPGTRRSGAASARPPRALRTPGPSRSTPGSARTSSFRRRGNARSSRRRGPRRRPSSACARRRRRSRASRAPDGSARARARSRASPRRRSRHGSPRGRRRARRESPAPGREPPR